MLRHKISCRHVSVMLNFQRCSKELLINLLKVIRKSNKKKKLLNRLRKKKPNQLLKRSKKKRLLNNKLNQLL